MTEFATTNIRSDVSPSIHPDVTMRHASVLSEADGPGRRAYAEAREALASVYETIGQINDTERALLAAAGKPGREDVVLDGGVLRAKHGREIEFEQAAQRAFDRAARRCDASLARVRAEHGALEKRVTDALGGDQPGGPLASEVRAHFKALSGDGRRADALLRAADEKDVATLRAVLNAPAFLSGFSASDLAALKDQARRRVAPADHAQLDAVADLVEHVMQAGSALMNRMLSVRTACERESKSARGNAERQLRALGAS